MTQEEFIHYVKGIIDTDISLHKENVSPITNLIKEALEKLFEEKSLPNCDWPAIWRDIATDGVSNYENNCACNPKNGGSGICHCTAHNTTNLK